jgi:hypothetical protein
MNSRYQKNLAATTSHPQHRFFTYNPQLEIRQIVKQNQNKINTGTVSPSEADVLSTSLQYLVKLSYKVGFKLNVTDSMMCFQ